MQSLNLIYMQPLNSFRHLLIAGVFIFTLLMSCKKNESNTTQNNSPLITDSGTPIGDVATTSIGSGGGSVQSADGNLTVTIPANALSSNTTISIQPITNEAPLGLNIGYRLLPEGTTFSKPIRLTFHYNDQLLDGTPDDFLWIVTQSANRSWNAMLKSAVDKNAKTVSVQTTHFSDWALGRFIDLSLNPASAIVQKGQSIQLRLFGFVKDQAIPDDEELAPLIPITSDDDGLTPLTPIPPIESRYVSFKIKQWTLNAVAAPVSNSNGSLNATGNGATYTAPNQKPPVNPVAVTVEVETSNKEGSKSKFYLISNITVVTDYYVLVKIDGNPYEYTQYGFTETTPKDPNNYSLVLCGLTDGKFTLLASIISPTNGAKNVFELTFDNPSKSTHALIGSNKGGNDVLNFVPLQGASPSYELDYTQRVSGSGTKCDRTSLCGSASVTLTTFGGPKTVAGTYSEVLGHFSGTVYMDKPEYDDHCQSSDKHVIEGEFWVMMSN